MMDPNPATPKTVTVNPDIRVGAGEPLLLMAGPCVLESEDHALSLADQIQTVCRDLPINLVFKSSFDKANRTSWESARGPGLDSGLEILSRVRESTGLPIVTDIHLPEQAASVAEAVDILQTPAFLCRQTDLLVAAGATGKPVNVKKGQFLHSSDMEHTVEKIRSTGNDSVLLCERGSCFGYRELVVDMRNLAVLRDLGCPVVFDATHSIQVMGGEGSRSGGTRRFIRHLVRAATAVGVDGLFIECHENPDSAPSDSASMLPINELRPLLDEALRIREVVLT